jgi:lysozyme
MTDWEDMAVALIMPFEGCEKRASGMIAPYLDRLAKPPVWTRGYGRTYGIAMNSPPITPAEARDELREGVRQYGLRCAALAPELLGKPECLAAVTSWVWNCGCNAFKASRLRRAINAGQWQDAAQYIRKPDTAGGIVYRGLTRRREAERVLFILGVG